ncbi:MAG: hypothetical protein HC884_07435 [Chloroflexaceae bacterium]|nr:hypothetical protein [Chloroflexaceae bacterium]
MDQRAVFLQLARQEGFYPDAALAAFNTIEASLNHAGYGQQATFYVYRMVRHEGTEAEAREAGGLEHEPTRLLLVFSSPDAALAFAQQHQLRPTPRLLSLNLAQLLATLVQRPAIKALIFSEEHAAVSPETRIPTVFHLERQELLVMLKGTTP